MLPALKTIQKRVAVVAIMLTALLLGESHAATFKVTRNDDRNVSTAGCPSSPTSDCSLREAITLANTSASTHIIDFVVPTSVITLNIPEPISLGNAGLTLNGNGVIIQRSLAAANFAIFLVFTSNAVFNSMTIANGFEAAGRSGGGAILVGAGSNLAINDSIIKNNTAQNGGAIYVDGNTAAAPTQLTLTNTSVLNNTSTATGGIFNGGGGIYVEPNAKLTLINTFVVGNASAENGGGLFVDGLLSVDGGRISGNLASFLGGGMYYARTASNGATLVNAVVDGNTANLDGGGVYAGGTTFNVSGGAFSNNRAPTGEGGGLYSQSTSIITATTFVGNAANTGGGISNHGSLSVNSSVLRGNTARGAGGGLANINSAATATLSNTTVSGNAVSCGSPACIGGGIVNSGGPMRLLNATISNNRSNTGGGVAVFESIGVSAVRNTIIAGNQAVGGGTSPDVNGVFNSLGNNLIGNTSGSANFTAAGDIAGTIAAPIDAKLRPLGNYGGATFSQPPFADSPAVDAGNNCVAVANACGDGNPALLADQRGLNRFGNVANIFSDIGAVELQTAIVTNLSDYVPAATPISNTLRSFVESTFPYDRILFDQSKFPSTNTSINLVAPLTINRPLEIFGFNAESPKITGAGQSGTGSFVVRIFNVTGAGDLKLANVSLRVGGGLPASGAGSGNGGIIENFGRLSLSNCEISFGQTAANGSGGGLFNGTDGTVEIDRCSFTANKAAVGGAIFNLGKLKVSRSTFAFNTASLGAAISSADAGPNSPLLTSVTIAKNTATTSGGGIRYTRSSAGSSATLQNSIVAENTAPASPDVLGDFTSLGNNLIGRFDGSTGFTNGTNADIVGSLATPVTANLIASSGTTVNNGGQAFTLRPLPASRVINNGVALGSTTDQRGFPRTVGGAADIGAIEFNMTPIGTLEGARRRLANSNAGIIYTQTIEAFGAGAFTFTATTLPPFLTLTPSIAAPSTATLAGTPSLAQAGTYTFSITATAPAPDAFTVSNDYTLVVGAAQPILNIDNSSPTTIYDAATDGVLLVRYLLGYRGAALIANARGSGVALRTSAEIEAHIATKVALFDVDGDGQTLALTDGVMILRRLLNPAALTTNAAAMAAITANAKRGSLSDAAVVIGIDALMP